MRHKSLRFLAVLATNLLAAYAPGVLWLPGLPGSRNLAWEVLFSPVFFVLLAADAMNPVVAWGILFAFLGLVGVGSAAAYRWKTARLIMPWAIAAYSLLQGVLAAALIAGIDAIGHS